MCFFFCTIDYKMTPFSNVGPHNSSSPHFLSSPPKSVFTGSLGCGNLSERRASGLVFCESDSSEYRTICVSPTVLLHPDSVSISRVLRWCGVEEEYLKPVSRSMCWLHGFTEKPDGN